MFSLTVEQEDLADGVSNLLAARATGPYVREVMAGTASWRDVWADVAELGIASLVVPEADGGLGLGAVEVAAVSEVCGHFLVPAPVVATAGQFVPPIAAAGGAAASCLTRVLDEGATGTLAFAEPLTPLPSVELRGGRLTVEDLLVPDAVRLDYFAFILGEEGSLFIAVLPSVEASIENVDGLDPTRPLGRLSCDAASVAISPIGSDTAALVVPLVSAASELVGMADQMLSLSIQYAGEREQFGSPIGSFQAVKHRLVDSHLQIERARSLTFSAAVLSDDPDRSAPEQLAAARLAMAVASEAATETARSAVQVHGGVGVTAEHDVSLLYLRARQASMQLGGRDANYLAAADAFIRDGKFD